MDIRVSTPTRLGLPIKIKKLSPKAQLPVAKTLGSAGADLTATEMDLSRLGSYQIIYKTGLALEIPEGYVGLIYPRSSIRDTPLSLSNSTGVIDSDYRGEITFTFNYRGSLQRGNNEFGKYVKIPDIYMSKIYQPGDRIGQLVVIPIPLVYYVEVEDLSSTERGDKGHGSTGRS